MLSNLIFLGSTVADATGAEPFFKIPFGADFESLSVVLFGMEMVTLFDSTGAETIFS